MGRRLQSLHAATEKTGTVLSIRQYPDDPSDLPKEVFDFAYDVDDPPIHRHIDHFSMVGKQVPLRGTNNAVKNESMDNRRAHHADTSHNMHWDTPRHNSWGRSYSRCSYDYDSRESSPTEYRSRAPSPTQSPRDWCDERDKQESPKITAGPPTSADVSPFPQQPLHEAQVQTHVHSRIAGAKAALAGLSNPGQVVNNEPKTAVTSELMSAEAIEQKTFDVLKARAAEVAKRRRLKTKTTVDNAPPPVHVAKAPPAKPPKGAPGKVMKVTPKVAKAKAPAKSKPGVAKAKAEPVMKRPVAAFGYTLTYWKLANKRSFQCAHYFECKPQPRKK